MQRHNSAAAALRAAVGIAAVGLMLVGCSSSTSGSKGSNGTAAAKKCTYGVLPKQVGNQYWDGVDKGVEQAAKELGIKVVFNGPTTADPAGQTQFINSWTQQHFCAISLSATDPNALVPALQQAKAAGIKVSTFDADTAPVGREVFLNQATYMEVAQALVDQMVKFAGDKGNFLVVTSTLTAPNQSQWVANIRKYIAAKYPGMHIAAVLPGQEENDVTEQLSLGYLRAHPNTTGIMAVTQSTPGIAAAKQQLNLTHIPVVGIGPPSCCKDVLGNGLVNSMSTWSPIDIGYADVYVMYGLVSGAVKPGDKTVQAGRLGTLKFVSHDTVLLSPTVPAYTKSNMNSVNF